MFPLGNLYKREVREIARKAGLPNHDKKDSTGICFIGERPFRAFLERYLANTPGPIRDDRDRVIGEHVGLSFYTIGPSWVPRMNLIAKALGQWATELNHVTGIVGGFNSQQKYAGQDGVLFTIVPKERQAAAGYT